MAKKKKMLRRAAWIGGILLAAVLGGALLIRLLNYFPDDVIPASLVCKGKTQQLARGSRFRLVNWNIQYGASRKYHFFYDGGKAVYAEKNVVMDTIKRMNLFLKLKNPDFLMLQEVDRDSSRTHRIDELERISSFGGFACVSSTPYHRSRYVPAPLHRPLGRVDMHLATLSRYELAHPLRHSLPTLKEIFIRRAFNLKRAVLSVTVPIEGSKAPLVLLNTHLSAFSYGDGTLDRQVNVLIRLLEELDRKKNPWILAGDFNMLPPKESPSRLKKEANLYADANNPIERIFARYRSAIPLEAYRKDPGKYYTYLPFGADKPDRKLDYVFISSSVVVHDVFVPEQDPVLSDHLPIVLEASVP